MSTSFFLGSQLLPLEAIKLARLVIDVNNVLIDNHDSACSPPIQIINEVDSIREFTLGATSPQMQASFVNLVSALHTNQSSSARSINAVKAKTYSMDRANAWFRNAIEHQEDTRRWLEEQYEDGVSVFLITGYATLQDATIAHASASSKKEDFTLGEQGVTGAQVATQDEQRTTSSTYTASGEKVFALQYRQVMMRRWPWHEIKKAKLDKGKSWKILLDEFRGEEDETEVWRTISAGLQGEYEWTGGEGEISSKEDRVIGGVRFGLR